MTTQPAHQRLLANTGFIFLRQRHLHAGKEQEGAENIEQPFELGNQPATGKDHDGTQHDRAQHAIHQHPTLQGCRHRKIAEQHQPDEDVIHRQGFFNQIAGEERQRLRIGHRAALRNGEIPPEGGTEEQRERDPHQRPGGRLLHGHAMRAAPTLQKEIDRQHDDHNDGESSPHQRSTDSIHTIFLPQKKTANVRRR